MHFQKCPATGIRPTVARGFRTLRLLATAAGLAASGAALAAGPASTPQPLKRVTDVSLTDSMRPAHSAFTALLADEAAADAGARVAVLNIDGAAYQTLKATSNITIDLPIEAADSLALELERFEVFTPDAAIVVAGDNGQRLVDRPDVQFWRGRVAGDADSRAYLSMTPEGAQGFVVTGEKTYSVSTVPAHADGPLAGRTVCVEAGAMSAAAALMPHDDGDDHHWSCGGALEVPGAPQLPPDTGELPEFQNLTTPCRVIRAAIDTDREFTTNLFGGNTTNATAYATQLMGAVSSIYHRDVGVQIQVSYLRVWSTTAPYNATSTSAQLTQFRSYWMANRPATPHDFAHLICGRALGGGVAYVGALCQASYHFGVSANLGGSFPYPVVDNNHGNWDLTVVAHEIGHNFGSGHTHDPAYYNPPVDGCGAAYLSPPQTQDCTVATQGQGSLMSYCHMCGGGLANLKMSLGTRPSQRIMSYLSTTASSCGITASGTPPSVNSVTAPAAPVCRGGTATISVSASGGSLTYAWSRNSTLIPGATGSSLVLNNLTQADAGSYTCAVSNGCSSTTTAPRTLTVCVADFDCSTGAPGPQDVFSFMTAWFGNAPAADINGQDGVTVQDVFDFLSAWFNGC